MSAFLLSLLEMLGGLAVVTVIAGLGAAVLYEPIRRIGYHEGREDALREARRDARREQRSNVRRLDHGGPA